MSTKEKILECSFKLFLREGFTDVSINDVMTQIGISKAGFFSHFKNKDELLTEVMKKYLFSPLEELLSKQKNTSGSAKEKLFLLFKLSQEYEDFLKETIHDNQVRFTSFFLLLMEGIKKYKYFTQFYEELHKKRTETIEAILDEGKIQGSIRKDIDTKKMALHIHACSEGVLLIWAVTPDIDIKGLLEENFNIIWDSIREDDRNV